jgi:hypothetical protein
MSFKIEFLSEHFYLPRNGEIPFGNLLNELFLHPSIDQTNYNRDFVIHGPNAIRFIDALMETDLSNTPGLLRYKEDRRAKGVYQLHYQGIIDALEANVPEEKDKVCDLLKIALLYHDIGKSIRRANHPPIGANLIRNFDEDQSRQLVDALKYQDDRNGEARHNRFSLIASIIQHHDKFGVVSTGEGGLPLFSDILYFTSDVTAMKGIKKNITSVMLANLSDIASVCTATMDQQDAAYQVAQELWGLRSENKPDNNEIIDKLARICQTDGVSLGLDRVKLEKVLNDWDILIKTVEDKNVNGDRVKLKRVLLEYERNPARAIKRILRLLQECATTSNCDRLIELMSPTSVESILVGTLGAHQFQTFCELLATVSKLDYGLNFFKAIVCACVRKKLDKDYNISINPEKKWPPYRLSKDESSNLDRLSINDREELVSKITTLFVRTLEGLLNRYIGVLGYLSSDPRADPRRFGFQMRALTSDEKIRDTIINLLCVKEQKDPIALTWLVDEVTIWSMD